MTKKWYQDVEYLTSVEDLLACSEVQALSQFVHHHSSDRLRHSLDVSYLSYRIGKRLKLNEKSLARAGILHDLFYYYPSDTTLSTREHARLHPQIALNNARKITNVTPLEQDIILSHMFLVAGPAPRHRESIVLTLADKICAVKEFTQYMTKRWRKQPQYVRSDD